MKTSVAGIAALKAREGKRMLAYRDSQGVLTIGVGHTGRMSPPAVYAGMKITQAECDAFLATDLAPVEKIINGLGATLTQNQFDACASLAFNIGAAGFQRSTVAKLLHEGKTVAAADAFLLWDKPAVLLTRRQAERRQFLTPDHEYMPKAVMSATQGVAEVLKKAAAGSSIAPISVAVSAAAKPPAAPVAAAPAPPVATTKAASMTSINTSAIAAAHPAVAAALPGVNFLQGAINTAESFIGSLTATLAKAADPSDPSVTISGHNVVSSTGGIVGTISNVKSAIGKITEIVADAKKGDVQEAVADGVDLGSIVFATLDTYKIDLPVVTGIFLGKPNLHSGGVDKGA